jgi:hypothetical protein
MASEQKLFDLFGEFTSVWPSAVQRLVGILGPGSGDPDLSVWLAALNSGTQIKNSRVGAGSDRVSVAAELTFDNAQATYAGKPDGFPFVFASMPDVEFRIQTVNSPKTIQLFAAVSEGKAEVVIEGLPVEILLPIGLIQPPATSPAEVTESSFTPGTLDHLSIVYRRFQPTSIFVHIRLIMNEDNEFIIRPAVPINFGKCLFSDVPVKAIHDFSLIPSPTLVPNNIEWIRHTVEPWFPNATGPLDGLFAARSIDVDEETAPIKDISDVLNRNNRPNPEAEFVLDDLVVPFFAPYVIPIPRHITIGIRRRTLDATDIGQIFAFSQAPVQVFLTRDPNFGLIINSLFYKSLPSEDLTTDLGLTFSAVIFFGENESAQHGFEISLSENYTPLIGYRRGFSSTTGLPEPGTGAAATINALLHWEIAGSVIIDIMAFRGGYSLGRSLGEGRGFGDCFEFTGDLFVSMPPTGGDTSVIRMRSLDGQRAKFALLGLGWKQGSFHFEGLALPNGVAIFFGPVKIIILEFGLVAENGGSYLSFSGGLGLDLPSGFSGSLIFRRLRFRISGNPNAPFFKLDGIFIALRFGSTVRIDVGGFYSEREIAPNTTLKEFGLTGTVGFEVSAIQYLFALDILAGSLKAPAPADSFDFFMFQIVFRGSVTISWFELRGVRVLFARNMQPKLEPANNEAYELRYYNWYKATNPISVPGDRRLAAWQPQKDSWTLGIGVGASFAQLGRVLELGVFVLVVSGNDESGFLIVAEALLLQNPNPIAFIAIQWDGKNDQFSMLIGVNLRPRQFLSSIPAWVDRIARITGTLFICNKPVVVALGRLSDTRTWFSLIFEFDVWVRFFIQFGICFEYSEAPGGGKGFGLIVRLEGTINGGIVRVDFNAGFGFVVSIFTTASNDYAASIWIEAGVRIVLFFFLRFGISARAEFRNVGSSPSRGELRAEFRLETPWFLPDVTWTFEVQFGSLEPAGLATSVSALRSAMAVDTAREKAQVVHVERIDQTWTGNGVAQTWSVNQLRGMALAEAPRLTRFLGDADAKPIATDSAISIEFSVAVNDNLGIGGAAPGFGNQNSSDLRLSYDLIGVAVRRRARFGSDKSWRLLQEKIELTADFSDPSGVDLSGSFSPQQLTMFWAPEEQIDGQTVPKKLRLNARTPYEFQTKNQEVDEQTVKNNPSWPCCGGRRKQPFRIHELNFHNDVLGGDIVGYRLYSQSQSRFRFLRPTYAFNVNFGSMIAPGTIVSLTTGVTAGIVFRAELDEDAAICFFRLYWGRSQFLLQLVAYDEKGNVVSRLNVAPGSDFQDVLLPLSGPARRIEARVIGSKFSNPNVGFAEFAAVAAVANPTATLLVDRAGYVGLRDYLDYLVGLEACDPTSDGFQNGYSGRGALSFLPNHEYEVALTIRITVSHPSAPAESVETKEYVYFKTKGLPGLNAVETVGDEVAPYVRSVYEGGRGTLYREEPVAIVFEEDFHVAVPLPLRPPGTSEERNTLLVMKLLVKPDIAQNLATVFTTTTPDWIVENRSVLVIGAISPYISALSVSSTVGTGMISNDPFRGRLAEVINRPTAVCPLPDPLSVVGTALIAMPQGETDPLDPTKQLWPANTAFTAMVKPDQTGFIDRTSFVSEDLTAFDFSLDAGAGGGAAWTLDDEEIAANAGATRHFAIFGEATWNYVTVELSISQPGSAAGIGVALPAGDVPSRGLFVMVQPTSGGHRIAIFQRNSGVQFTEIAQLVLPPAADSNAPILLAVTTFDDKLRASVGEAVLEVEREELREGRMSIVAQGNCRFASLRVQGIDIYKFPFKVSRFRSFTDHIGSFVGPADVIQPNALGPGTTTTTSAAIFSATFADITTAMQPAADPAGRQKLFERWTRELGIPLKDEVNQLEISRFVAGTGTEFFLIESPEPLDFSEETTIELSRRVRIPNPLPFPDVVTGTTLGRSVFRKATAREDLVRALELAETAVIDTEQKSALLDVTRLDDELEIHVDAETITRQATAAEPLLLVEAAGRGDERKLNIYSVSSPPGAAKGEVTLRSRKTDEIAFTSASSLVSERLSALEEGAFALVTSRLWDIIGSFRPIFVWRPVPVIVLQDATALRALVIPATSGTLQPLTAGTYRLKFTLDRRRWETTDPPSDLNRYQRSSTINFVLTD